MELTETQINYCMECGVCTGSCPVSMVLPSFSPRRLIKSILMDSSDSLLTSRDIWLCLTCARCSKRCPVEIDFPEFARHWRKDARNNGNTPIESHHGLLQGISRLQTLRLRQNRIEWAKDAGRFSEKGDTFYFVGCLPFFDVIFSYLEIPSIEIGKSVLRLLNKIGIEPVISNDERCCGHDALWSGDEKRFLELAKINLEVITGAGAKRVLFSCPEGYYTFKHYYPKYFGELPFDVIYLSNFLEQELSSTSDISFAPSTNGKVTFQDPCRLGRLSGIYDSPRKLINLVPDTNLVEMARSRENSLCCGTSAWMECSSYSKTMQTERLTEAIKSGAETIITACPKCLIHLTCAKENTPLDIPLKDIYTYLADKME